ncbi:hypothetical protein SAMN05216464_101636 [Mucilaginibacter pineti]|uniref:ABC-2 family transporter protein n=1 Tax=Mucilaginibacter pineti TaxID=1391627 RepID=A0A1G6UFN6_9SPHI|nr:hypothetical protein [Mucilaginibacter pineti]SDD40220.1 hypothetical protein SAMN05216464_101636 [Mucilaginibacter pineti]
MQFSIHRVWLLCRKQWAENTQLYILGILATAGIISAVLIYNMFDKRGIPLITQQIIFFTGLIISGAVFTSTILSQFNEKVKGIQALTLPASTLEKLTAAIIYGLVMLPAIYLIVIYPFIALAHYIDIDILGRFNDLYVFKANNHSVELGSLFIITQAIMLLGSVVFRRYIFIKTTILTIVITVGITLFNPYMVEKTIVVRSTVPRNITVKEQLYNGDNKLLSTENAPRKVDVNYLYSAPYQDLNIFNSGRSKVYNGVTYSSDDIRATNPYANIFYILLYLAIPFLWIITWFRLREKQL